MSQPSRPRSHGPAPRRRRQHRIETIQALEERCLLAPFLPLAPDVVTVTAAAAPTNPFLATVTVTPGVPAANAANVNFLTAAPVTSVSELTPIASFGNDIVRIKAGPGGDFGKSVYAISRGAGANVNANAVNRPGVIYRVDPATGKSSVFFDLNTVLSQLEPNGNASNSVGVSTGLVNWYDIAFDPEGYFDGRPSMFVSSVDRADPNKNAVYRIAPDGSFLGMFVQFTDGQNAMKFNVNPTSVLVPPPEDQSFLRGLFTGSGITTTGGTFSALFFDANAYTPGQKISNATLPVGVNQTALSLGNQLGLTASNPDYLSRVYSVFTDFGTPAAGGLPGAPGLSGVQGLGGESLISGVAVAGVIPPVTAATALDQQAAVTTPFRRFDDISFDQYGYFSQGFTLTAATANTGGTNTGQSGGAAVVGGLTISAPVYAGSVFVADLATGLKVQVAPLAPLPVAPIQVPIQGSGPIGVQSDGAGGATPIITNGNTTGGSNIGGRVLRIQPNGVVTTFAEGFNTSGAQDSTSLVNSMLSISFSADGTTFYAADNDGIWQFKTVTSLAGSTSGSIIGLNDLRSLGVPYEGQDSAVAVIDTGVDANSTPFRGRVAPGNNVVTNGFGNVDTSPGAATTNGQNGGNGGNNGGNGNTINVVTANSNDGHGTLVAGVIAQFVPQATILPVNIFNPFEVTTFTQAGNAGNIGGNNGGNGGNGANGVTVSGTSNATSSSQYVYQGLDYVSKHPFVNDPVRPNKTDRVIATALPFGSTITFDSEGSAYRQFPQIVLSFKSKLKQFRKLGIAPIAAAGQFGAPFLAGTSTGGLNNGGNGGIGGIGNNLNSTGGGVNNNSQNPSIGDNNGMALPAILNDVISVTGSYPFPFATGPDSPPTDPFSGVVPQAPAPLLISAFSSIGGTAPTGTGNGNNNNNNNQNNTSGNNISLLTAGDFTIYHDRILASSNRNWTTDFAAPAIDVPTFRRTFVATTTTTGTAAVLVEDPRDHNTFTAAGTSMSNGIVTGAYALVASALNYWTKLNGQQAGVSVDGYLTTPVGVNKLNYGPHPFKNLQGFNNPDGINGILAWTAVPATDANNGLSATNPPTLFGGINARQYARIDVGNAIAAIEGYVAINYLLQHKIFPIIDTNHNGLITAAEIQNFVDNSAKMGLAEAGSMARLLGGTARIPLAGVTAAGEQPEQPDVLQRRFNFFDYAADGQLNGAISMAQIRLLAHNLLPLPSAYTITDRARASANGFLLDPASHRNFQQLQHLQPSYMFVSQSQVRRFNNLSPTQFKVDRGQDVTPGTTFPLYALFDPGPNMVQTLKNAVTQSGSATNAASPSGNQTASTPSPNSNKTANTTTTTTTNPSPTQVTPAPTGSVPLANPLQSTQVPTAQTPSSSPATPSATTPTANPAVNAVLGLLQNAAANPSNSSAGGTQLAPSKPVPTAPNLQTAGTLSPTTSDPTATSGSVDATAVTAAATPPATSTTTLSAPQPVASQAQGTPVTTSQAAAATTSPGAAATPTTPVVTGAAPPQLNSVYQSAQGFASNPTGLAQNSTVQKVTYSSASSSSKGKGIFNNAFDSIKKAFKL